MANLMFTDNCNLSCPYCFANKYVNKECNNISKNISIENFEVAVDFILSGDDKIGIIGGEPLLHPQFDELLKRLINNSRVRKIVLFTNGILLDKYIKLLTNEKISILVNCNSPTDMGKDLYDRMTNNIRMAINEYNMVNNKVRLGFNMYKENFEYEYMLNLLEEFNLNNLRVSIAVPNNDELRKTNSLEYFKKMKPSVFNFFSELRKRNIMPMYDCNIVPTCLINSKELELLESFYELEKINNVPCNMSNCSNCHPVIDISTDLTAVRCFGMSEAGSVPILLFKNLNELENYFSNQFDSFSFNVLSAEKCRECELRLKQYCSGGCLAFKKDRIKKAINLCNNI